MNQQVDPEDSRKFRRNRSFFGGKIVTRGGHSVYDCIVKDISETGARLKVEDSIAVEDTFALKISDGRSYKC